MGSNLYRLFGRIRAIFAGRQFDADLEEEMGHHLQELAEDNIKSGMAPDEAWTRARVSLGNAAQIKELHREVRGIPWFEQWISDLRYAFRLFRKDRAFTTVALVILAVGVGLNTTVFSLVNTVLLRPLPFAQADRLVWITNGQPTDNTLSGITSQVDTWERLQKESRTLDRIEAYNPFSVLQTFRLTGTGDPQTILAIGVSHGLFGLLGMKPKYGRFFLPEDALKNAPLRVVLSHPLWVRRFGADPGIVGRTVQINGAATEVVGVMPPADAFSSVFFPAVEVDLYTAVQNDIIRPEGNALYLIGHMKPGATQKQIEADLPLAIDEIRKTQPWINAYGQPLHNWVLGSLKKPLLFLWTSAAFVLAIVGFNLGGLLLARGRTRRREMALRVALGASRARIMSQLLTECLGLVMAGSMLGSFVAWGFIHYLSVRTAVQIPLLQYLKLDSAALGYTVILCLITAVVCGAAPAWRFSGGRQMGNPLSEVARGASSGPSLSRSRSVLVILEVALAFSLAVSATLMVMSLQNLLKVDLGFQPSNLIAVRVDPGDQDSQSNYLEAMLDRVRALPGVERAGVTDCIPVERDRGWYLFPVIPGKPDGERGQGAHVRIVSSGLIGAMGTPILAGRDFTRGDEKASPKVVINQSLARKMWPDEDAIGRQVNIPEIGGEKGTVFTVIGVVGNVRSSGPEMPAGNEFYLTMNQYPWAVSWDLMVRTKLPVAALTAGLRQTLAPLDPTLPLTKARSMQTIVDRTLSSRRLLVFLVGGFAAIAITLALIGLYGVISYSVSQQTREIGIRMALGASSGIVQRQIVYRTVVLALIGLVLGLTGTLLGGQLLRSMLYGVSSNDAAVYVEATLTLFVCSIGAGYLPARRASRIDPAMALRAE
jgi:predicted permease